MSSQAEEDATISFPSIAVVAIIGFLIYRYFFAVPSSSTVGSSRGNNGLRFTNAQVDTVAQMFPQLSRRDIMWDLQRNRGSVQATTERVLAGRGLDPAPPTWQPPVLQQQASTTSNTQTSSIFSKPKSAEPDLITRYNLQSRIASSDKGKGKEEPEMQITGTSIPATKEDRQKVLQRRRDEMILQARRKMLEKDALRSGGEK